MIGDITYVMQIGLALMQANMEIKACSGSRGKLTNTEGIINWCALWALVFSTAGEFVGIYAMATTDYYYSIIESILWAASYSVLLPCAGYLVLRVRNLGSLPNTRLDTRQTHLFLQTLMVICLACLAHLVTDMIPHQQSLLDQDAKQNKEI